jgi:hypothetical protein
MTTRDKSHTRGLAQQLAAAKATIDQQRLVSGAGPSDERTDGSVARPA